MKRLIIPAALLMFGLAPAAFAQGPEESRYNHGGFGAVVNYMRLSGTGNTNFWGLGGRFSLNFHRNIQIEAESSYYFEQSFNEGFNDTSTGSVTFVRSPLRILDGMIGPKIQSSGRVRVFGTVKGGFINLRFDRRPATFETFASTVQGLRDENINPVLYPGGGVEAYVGPVGLRLEVGDEIYFRGGGHNNLRISFGPQIRF